MTTQAAAVERPDTDSMRRLADVCQNIAQMYALDPSPSGVTTRNGNLLLASTLRQAADWIDRVPVVAEPSDGL